MYYIADILVLARFILAALLGIVAFVPWPGYSSQEMVGFGLIIFLVGELTDALDGPAARRWHYPRDNKYRWWRENRMNVVLDKIADLCLSTAMVVFVFVRVSKLFAVGISCAIVPFALLVEFELAPHLRKTDPRYRKDLLLFRRLLYVAMIYAMSLVTLWSTPWQWWMKLALSLLSVFIVWLLARLKRNRLTQVDTPL